MKKMNDPKQNNRLNVLSDRECKRLAKRAASMAIAAALASSVLCAPALAYDYTIDETHGTVHTGTNGDHVISWQEGHNQYFDQDNYYDHTDNQDNVINITGKDSDGDGITTTDQILDVGTGTTGVEDKDGNKNEQLDININDVDVETTGESAIHVSNGADVDIEINNSSITSHGADAIHIDDTPTMSISEQAVAGVTLNLNDVNLTTDGSGVSSVYVGDNTVGQLILSAVQMEVNGTGSNGIEVGSGSDVDIELNENETKGETSGVSGVNIELNANNTSGIAVQSGENEGDTTNVTITVNGTATIQSGEATEGELVADLENILDEINHKLNPETGDTDGPLAVNMAGIVVGGEVADSSDSGNNGSANVTITADQEGSTLEIGTEGNGVATGILVRENDDLTIKGENLTVDIEDPLAVYSTVSGTGVMSYGDVTITDGATVQIHGAHDATDNGYEKVTSPNTGIRVNADEGSSKLIISEDATLEISEIETHNNNEKGTGAAGIYIESYNTDSGTDNSELKVDGATINISDVEGGGIVSSNVNVLIQNQAKVNIGKEKVDEIGEYDIGSNGIALVTDRGKKITIDNATVKVHNANAYGGIQVESTGDTSGAIEILNDANVDIRNIASNAINADAGNITIQGSTVTIDQTRNGLNMASDHENVLLVDGAQVTMTNVSNKGINLYARKNVQIINNAVVDITMAGDTGNGVYMYGDTLNGSTMVVEDATLDLGDSIIKMADTNGGVDQNLLEIRNGAKVVTGSVQRSGDGTIAKLVITGGTLDLTSENADGLNANHEQTLYDKSNDDVLIWPTNGEDYGDEKLVNFQLSVNQLKALLERLGENANFSMDDNGLSFVTYGLKSGEYVEYDAERSSWLGTQGSAAQTANGYYCDLTKYEVDENGDKILSVWVPAVVLDYYYGDSVDGNIEDMTEDQLQKLEKQEGSDVVIRGQSINFATLNENYTSSHLQDTDKEWYYFTYVDGEGNVQRFDADTALTPEVLQQLIGEEISPIRPDDDYVQHKNIYGIAAPTTGGGGGTITPIPTPDPDPEDELELILTPVPTEEELPETETPLAGAPEEIPEEETPLTDAPVIDESLEEIGEEDVPLASAPKTGDESGVFGLMAVLSGMALAVLSFIDRKGRHARFGSQH